MKLTYTCVIYGKLPKIPSSVKKQIELLEHAVFDLVELFMDEAGWDNPASVFDTLANECNLIASRAYDRSYKKREIRTGTGTKATDVRNNLASYKALVRRENRK